MDDLKAEMNQRFDAVDRRFDAQDKYINQRFDAVDRRFDAQDKYINQRFDAQDKYITSASMLRTSTSRTSPRAFQTSASSVRTRLPDTKERSTSSGSSCKPPTCPRPEPQQARPIQTELGTKYARRN